MSFLKSFRGEKTNCSRCHKQLGFSKEDPYPSWGFEGKICKDCKDYIEKGIAIYKVEYVEGHSELPVRTEGILSIYLFDHQNRILFQTKSKNFMTEINTDNLLECDTLVLEEKSTTRQILTAGFSDSKSKEHLRILFKDASTEKNQTLILDVDYPLVTVQKNLEPIIVTANNKRKETTKILDPVAINCSKCNFENSTTSRFCSSCGQRLQSSEDTTELIAPYQGRDYMLYRGERTKEEIEAEDYAKRQREDAERQRKDAEDYAKRQREDAERQRKDAEDYAKRQRKADFVFSVKYLGGHKQYPSKKERDARISIFIDRIEIETNKFDEVIPYSCILKIYNANKEEVAGFLFIGPVGTWWKKNHHYTVIEYDDGRDTQALIFDFGKHLESKQGEIYERMIDAKRKLS
jgi:hypothetical protein